jgi:hypothetical protein
MELYHNILNLKRLKSILDTGFIYMDQRILYPCVYMTRDYNYLAHRGIRMVFDYGKLRQNYKVKPFSLKEYNELNDVKFIPKK